MNGRGEGGHTVSCSLYVLAGASAGAADAFVEDLGGMTILKRGVGVVSDGRGRAKVGGRQGIQS